MGRDYGITGREEPPPARDASARISCVIPTTPIGILPAMRVDLEQVLRHSGELQRARTVHDLSLATDRIVAEVTRYRASWIAWFENGPPRGLRMAAAAGPAAPLLREQPIVPEGTYPLLDEVVATAKAVVVHDARLDPRANAAVVAQLGTITIVSTPIFLGGAIRGALSVGTFGDEGVLPPTEEELVALTWLGALVGPAFDRARAVEERDRMLTERAVLERRLEGMQRLEMMGLLSAGIAHDLNNLLQVTVASLGRIQPESLGHDGELLVDALDALAHIRAIAKNLVHIGRESSTGAQRVSLTERVATTLEIVMPSIPRGVRIVRSAHADPVVDAEPTQIDQAITNLVLNARDAVGDVGRIDVDVSEHELDDRAALDHPGSRPGRYAVVQVRDSGPGIARDQISRIFDPLFTTKPMGTGLGLAVVSRIAERHGGFVSVSSPPGQGACFELFLPAR